MNFEYKNFFYETNDEDKYHDYICILSKDPLVRKYVPDIKKYTKKVHGKSLDNNSYFVTDRVYDSVIGYVHIFEREDKDIEFMYAIMGEYRSLGYGKALVKNVSDFLFLNDKELQSISLVISPYNKPSLYIASSNGFIKNGMYYVKERRDKNVCRWGHN